MWTPQAVLFAFVFAARIVVRQQIVLKAIINIRCGNSYLGVRQNFLTGRSIFRAPPLTAPANPAQVRPPIKFRSRI
jgi:hypothetical protein